MIDSTSHEDVEQLICFVDPPHKYESGHRTNQGHVLHCSGQQMMAEMESQGSDLGDWLITDLTPDNYTGLLTWEGSCVNKDLDWMNDCSPRFEGRWRPLQTAELLLLLGMESPPKNTLSDMREEEIAIHLRLLMDVITSRNTTDTLGVSLILFEATKSHYVSTLEPERSPGVLRDVANDLEDLRK